MAVADLGQQPRVDMGVRGGRGGGEREEDKMEVQKNRGGGTYHTTPLPSLRNCQMIGLGSLSADWSSRPDCLWREGAAGGSAGDAAKRLVY